MVERWLRNRGNLREGELLTFISAQKQKPSSTLRWSLDAGSLVVLRANPHLVKQPSIQPDSFTLTIKTSCMRQKRK